MGPNNIVLTWRDSNTVVFRSKRAEWNPFKGQLLLVSIDGGLPETLPLPRGGWCSFSPDGRSWPTTVCFGNSGRGNGIEAGRPMRSGLMILPPQATEKLTDNPAQDVFPMWHGDTIYFTSDRDDTRRVNLFALDIKTKSTRQITHFTEFDVKFPSLGDKAIVFENGGFIHRLDLEHETVAKVPIEIHEDMALGRNRLVDVSKATTSFDISRTDRARSSAPGANLHRPGQARAHAQFDPEPGRA